MIWGGGLFILQLQFGEFLTWLVVKICTSKKLFSSKLPSLNCGIIRFKFVPILPISPKMQKNNTLKSLPSKNPSLFIYLSLSVSFYPSLEIFIILCFVQSSNPRIEISRVNPHPSLPPRQPPWPNRWDVGHHSPGGASGKTRNGWMEVEPKRFFRHCWGWWAPTFPNLVACTCHVFCQICFFWSHDLRFFFYGGTSPGIFWSINSTNIASHPSTLQSTDIAANRKAVPFQ